MIMFADAEHLLSLEPDHAATPGRDPAAILAMEKRLAIACPASVRHWYERDDAIAVLAAHSNDDQPLAPHEMVLVDQELVFLIENQGVCRWAFRLDGRDDPEVVVQFERRPWQSCGCTFSSFVAAQIFDWANGWAEDLRTLCGDPPAGSTLAWLGERFRPGPVARTHVGATYRFSDDRHRVAIFGEEWRVASKTFADMDRLLEMLQPFYDEEM